MLREQQPDHQSDSNLALDEIYELDLRSILLDSLGLPAEVVRADFSLIHDRILDQRLFLELTNPLSPQSETDEGVKRRDRRRKALMPYLNQRLICVCIRLPGIIYTVEIDPQAEKVLHWEWQSM